MVLPFLSFHGHIVIRMQVHGLPVNALLDTGAESTILDLSLVERLPALESFPVSGYGVTLQGLTGELGDARVVRQVQLVLANENFHVKNLFAADLRRLTNFYGPQIQVVLGMRQLRNFDLTFHYDRHEVIFQRIRR